MGSCIIITMPIIPPIAYRCNKNLLEVGGNIQVAAVGFTKEDVLALIREELARGNYAPSLEIANVAGADQEDTVAALLDNIGLFG